MSKRLLCFVMLVSFFCVLRPVYAKNNPVDVPRCDIARNPKAFDGKLIRIRGTLNVYFEDFSLGIGDCDTEQGIWLAFGGDVPGIVASTVNDSFRKPGSDIKVNGVSYGIKKDDNFRKLYASIAARHGDKPDYSVTATLMGVFFSGKENRTAKGAVDFVGYGHLGCCALLVITQVSDVESVPPAHLDLRGVLIGVDGKPVEGFTVLDDILGGSPPERQKTVTNKQGEFAFSNSGQQLRFENPSYRPLALTVEPGGAHIRVKLQDAKQSDWVIPACREVDSSSRIGFSVLFALPKTMESSQFNNDGMRGVFIYPRGGRPSSAELIISSSSEEMTDAPDSLDSEKFKERWVKDSAGNAVGMDARGHMRHGGIGAQLLSRVVTAQATGYSRENSRMHWTRLLTLHASQDGDLSRPSPSRSDSHKRNTAPSGRPAAQRTRAGRPKGRRYTRPPKDTGISPGLLGGS